MTQMEQWLILSNILNYVQHSKFNSMNHSLNVKVVNRCKVRLNMEREYKELRPWPNSTKITRGILWYIFSL